MIYITDFQQIFAHNTETDGKQYERIQHQQMNDKSQSLNRYNSNDNNNIEMKYKYFYHL